MDTIQARLKAVIEVVTDERGRFAELEKLTKVSANSWKSFWHGRQRPTCDMIEAICARWPHFAFWIATGITDAKYGHVSSRGEATYPEKRRARRKKAEEYWELASAMLGWRRHCELNQDVQMDGVSERNDEIRLLELEIGRNAEQQALAGIEDAGLINDLVKLKTPSYLLDDEHDNKEN
ncbi:hypothetical protein GJ699_13600 [Duganella sp. FT80W]|uniref:Uncharacterized protein n=1 Tax=Duganella guangzhouensis TaxID=2666084 RepID=A0A6I2KY16_9BURK|nr:hypothetical protein [Duganella guangzhouensis]MRW91025.1 hypothetical protein [Duganella guangzhouensis]